MDNFDKDDWVTLKNIESETGITYSITIEGKICNNVNGENLKPCIANTGYLVVGIGGSLQLVARLVAQTFIPNPENKPTVNHIDGDKLNNHIDNLEWATHSENMQHSYDEGLRG